MKKYLLFFAVLFAALTVKAYDINYAGCYKSFKLEFQSVDENNQPITLSEVVTIPLEKDGVTNREVGFFVLSSTPFNTEEVNTSTGEQPFDALLLRTIATEGAMTVQLDEQGFGSSAGKTVPFLTNKLTARQSIDGLFAAMDYAEKNGIKVSDNYYTINTGISLAGGRAIAVQRYLEKYSSEAERSRFRLKQTICGAAPISASETFRYIYQRASTDDSMVKYLSFCDGFIKANAQGSLHAFSLSDAIDEEGNIRPEMLSTSTALGRAFWKALGKEDMQLDWTPATPIKYIHFTNDSIVTYKNAELALAQWGGEKLQMFDRDLSGMKWNVSLLNPVNEYVNRFAKIGDHFLATASYYAGMIDGCMRDTLIADTYAKSMNFKDMLTVIFDVSSGLNRDIPLNFGVNMHNGTLVIRTIGNCHFTGDIVDSTGTATTHIDVTLKPEVKDSLASLITCVDAQGYLRVPVEFLVTLPKIMGLEFKGNSQDLYQFIENLTAVVLHHNCPTEEEAKKYCDAINSSMFLSAEPIAPQIVAYYKHDTKLSAYVIEPYIYSVSTKGDEFRSNLVDLLKGLASMGVIKTDVTKYMSIDNQEIPLFGYTLKTHVTDDLFGECKFYGDIISSDSVCIGRVDFDIKGVDMNEDGTRQTMSIGFTVNLSSIPARVVGTCSNLNDAVLAALLCYSNLSCSTKAQAQAYADAVNQNVEMEFYVAQVNDDGTYSENPDYIDYGPVKASVTQDAHGAYYAQYGLNWMGKGYLPIMTVIDQLLK